MASCALNNNAACPHTTNCAFHKFVTQSEREGFDTSNVNLPEIKRMLLVYPPNQRSGDAMSRTKLCATGTLRPPTVVHHSGKRDGLTQLSKFIRLLDHLGTAPWASIYFDVNAAILRRLTAAHLKLIAPSVPIADAMHMIDPRNVLDGAGNLVWITNRQQGKTTTLARFLAALSIASPSGGLLTTVYSTSLDRSVELVKAAKAYLYWMTTGAGIHSDYPITLIRDNERMFCVSNGYANNEVIARPKNPESCRGDAPKSAIFDEIGFIGKRLWEEFAFPLLQVGGRIFTCATTPPPPNSFFAVFVNQVQSQNSKNDYFFELINHSLTCDTCLEAGVATECCHNLMYLPPWKSLVTLNQMLSLVANKDTYQMEVYGVLGGSGTEYIPFKLVDAALARETVSNPFQTDHIWLAIDPASHGVSDFAAIAFVLTHDGVHVIIGGFSINMNRCQTTEVQLVMHAFLKKIRQHPFVTSDTMLVPIIECNSNEILAMSILTVCKIYSPVFVPWDAESFDTGISPGIGVWMTHENKMAAIQCLYQCFLDGRISFATQFVVTDRSAFVSNTSEMLPGTIKNMLREQLVALQDQPDGSVSGKHLGNDDVACAMLLGIYWSMCARSLMLSQ